jgi:hypothetical protein
MRPAPRVRYRWWPIELVWRPDHRHYRRRYGVWWHPCPTRTGTTGGWIFHLGPLKIRFG